MNRILKYLSILFVAVLFTQCRKDDAFEPTPIVPYAEQYPKDMVKIDEFIDNYFMIVDPVTFDVNFKKIQSHGADSLPIRTQTNYPLKQFPFTSNGVEYQVYYINISNKVGNAYDPNYVGENLNPTRVDSVYTTYKGRLLDNTQFDQATNPVWFPLTSVVEGWGAVFPKFKTGDFTANGDGTISYSNFGAGVMFLPSGLAYYNQSKGAIASYSPLIFNFKLMGLNYIDHDGDRIDSKDEDLNNNGIFTDDDSDGDGRPNYLDKDDDGDNVLTKNEIKHTITVWNSAIPPQIVSVNTFYYPYNGAAVDNPATLVNEAQGIPACGDTDFTGSLRLRKHLDKNCNNVFNENVTQ